MALNRRSFMLSAGALGSLGLTGRRVTAPEDRLHVKVWFSPGAARHEGLWARLSGHLERAFDGAHEDVALEFGGVVDTSSERAYDLVVGGEWPATLAAGAVGGPAEPCDDVNLLVTDASMDAFPTGAGVPHVAAVGGAAAMADLPPVGDLPSVVERSREAYALQVLLHECGHALGLEHNHGSMRADDGALVVSPMVSGYPWETEEVREDQFDYEKSACGCSYVRPEGRAPRLMLTFDECEREEIGSYRGGVTSW